MNRNKTNKELFQAIRRASFNEITALIDSSNINTLNEFHQNLLQETISSQREPDVINYLLSMDINVNHQDLEGQTPLHFAAVFLNEFASLLILKRNGNPNLKDKYGNNALWTAVFNARGNYSVVKVLMLYGADSHSKNKANRSPLDFAKQIEDFDLVSLLE